MDSGGAGPLLTVDELSTWFHLRSGRLLAIDRVCFTVDRGECVALVGESGSGKSVTALSIMRLLPTPPTEITARALRLAGTDLLDLPEEAMRRLRGRDMAMIFQEPMTSLHPILPIRRQITETLDARRGETGRGQADITARALELMHLVRIPDPERRLREYPHQLSGGMRQRVMIAMALAGNPKLLIADEPTTALDVTIQAQILDLLSDLRAQLGMALLLITHDMGVVAENADRVLVMYAGRVVEQARVTDLFDQPLHPYTAGLMASIPRIDPEAALIPTARRADRYARGVGGAAAREIKGIPAGRQQIEEPKFRPAGIKRPRLNEIPGLVPSLRDRPSGCAFAPRCGYATERCRQQEPPLQEHLPAHPSACWEWQRLVR